MDKSVSIVLENPNQQMEKESQHDFSGSDEENEKVNPVFKVKICKAEPIGVKLSKRNTCMVTII